MESMDGQTSGGGTANENLQTMANEYMYSLAMLQTRS